ncbi:MAG TPA: helix-turn-helix transcriptional regulator [Candidatus Binatia bacterium]|nr:helix-turn-helix transcriptional regulator [Candidatus Binatia bacterium]
MPTTGDRIREVRAKREMTQDELARASGISNGFLSDIENNNRNVSSQALLRIANALGASVDYLLRGETGGAVGEPKPIVIPPELSAAAEELGLSFGETVELLEAHRSVIARRSTRTTRAFTVEDWKNLHKAIKKVFG